MKFSINHVTLITTFTILILSGLIFVSTPVFGSTSDYIKVGLKYSTTAVDSAEISCSAGLSLGTLDNGIYEELLPLAGYTQVSVIAKNGKIVVRSGDVILSLDIGVNGCFMPSDYNQEGIIKLNGTEYRGGISFFMNNNNTFNIINYITLDDYVKGVLNGEMHYAHPIEALKAQAVTARSYGAYNYNRHGSTGFDVCTTTHCQVYKGYTDEYTQTNKAVDETTGLEMYYDGKPVIGYYSKNSGGYTQNSEDVWNSVVGYLRAVRDEYSPLYPWEASFTFAELQSKLTAAGHSVGMISSVEITKRNESGAVDTLTFTGTGGTVKIEKEKIRTVLGAAIMKSTMFSFTDVFMKGQYQGNDLVSSGNGQAVDKIVVSNGSNTVNNPSAVYVLGSDGEVKLQEVSGLFVMNGKEAPASSSGLAISGGVQQTEITYNDPVIFMGAGYGHGIGMPQDSAIEMAKAGFSYSEILMYYFTGIEIK